MITVTEDMLKTGKPIAQGEVLIWAKKYAPQSVLDRLASGEMTEIFVEDGRIILGHSETGHHHVLEPADTAVPGMPRNGEVFLA